MNLDINMEYMYYPIPINYGYTLAMKDTGGDVPLMWMSESISVLDERTELEIYAEDDKWAYAVLDGEGYALRLDGEDDITEESEVVTGMVIEYPIDFLDNAEVSSGGSITKITLALTSEKIYEYFPAVFETVYEICGVDADCEFVITDAVLEITIDGKDFKKESLKYNMEFTNGGIYSTAGVEIDFEYTKFDGEVVITAPDGYLYFPEYFGSLIY